MSAVVSSDKLVPGQRLVLTLLGEKIQNPNVVRFVSMKAGEGLHVCGLSSSARARIDTSRDTCHVSRFTWLLVITGTSLSLGVEPHSVNTGRVSHPVIMAANFL